jgi:curved DNA-binding protein CbpA
MSKDYYRILGVLDDAEEIVIRAAYKALAQRYHPDKWTGSKDEANKRMSEINEAYGVLSDPIKRKQYDSTREKSEYINENTDEDEEKLSSIESDWRDVVEYFPDLDEIVINLSKISSQLVFSYKTILLEKKDFNQRVEIANILEKNYLKRYFGDNERIIDFAKSLLLTNNKKVAKELNKAVNLLGSKVDAELIIEKLRQKYPLDLKDGDSEYAVKYAQQLVRFPCYYYAKNFIEELKGNIYRNGDENNVKVYFSSQNFDFTVDEFVKFANTQAINYLKR